MLFRVDYTLALFVAGAIAAILASGRLAAGDAHRVARGYLAATGTVMAIRVAAFVATHGLRAGLPVWVSPLTGDLAHVLVGGLYGLAVVEWRGGLAPVLRAPELRLALGLSIGVSFALAGVAKAFYLDMMVAFFAQSGYDRSFLYFVMTTEVLGGMALVLRWRWLTLAAIAGLAVDMFGAIYTHAHNGDPIDDSSAAIAMLLELAPLAAMYVGRRWVATGAALCAVAAVAGGALVRHAAPPAVPGDELDYVAGTWSCAGTFARTGAPIEAELRAERSLDGRWLVVHHDDRPPNRYHALAEWSHGDAGWVASMQDSSGGSRSFRSAGWQGGTLIWEGEAGAADQRFLYHRRDDATLEIGYDTRDPAGWQRVDTLTCRRGSG